LQYLVDLSAAVFGRSGANMAGLNLLRPTELRAYAEGIDLQLLPYEFDAILAFDAARIFPDVKPEPPVEVEEEPEVQRSGVKTPAWPQRKE
jgi:hypothetical protein